MKKGFVLLVVMLLAVSFVVAKESVLIDFSLLTAADPNAEAGSAEAQNTRTLMDYSQTAGTSYTEDQKNAMKTSLVIENWDVVLNSSARTVASQAVSMTKSAPVLKDATVRKSTITAGSNVLGVRILFPAGSYNANALIKPPFEIPAFEPLRDESGAPREASEDEVQNEIDSQFQGGYGIIKNVGAIKSVALTVLGRNFPHSVYIVLLNEKQEEKVIPMGELNFDGWKELEWTNPQYIESVRNRQVRIYPMYPQSTPFFKFGGLKIVRDADHVGGDFVGYFKDIRVIYDLAILPLDSDVDDEDLWHIISDREVIRKDNEIKRFGNTQVLRYLETRKKATESFDVNEETATQEQAETPAAAN